jgi:hypothetical protein
MTLLLVFFCLSASDFQKSGKEYSNAGRECFTMIIIVIALDIFKIGS